MAKRARLEVPSEYPIATRWNPGSCCKVPLPAFSAPVGLRAASARLMCGLHSALLHSTQRDIPAPQLCLAPTHASAAANSAKRRRFQDARMLHFVRLLLAHFFVGEWIKC